MQTSKHRKDGDQYFPGEGLFIDVSVCSESPNRASNIEDNIEWKMKRLCVFPPVKITPKFGKIVLTEKARYHKPQQQAHNSLIAKNAQEFKVSVLKF